MTQKINEICEAIKKIGKDPEGKATINWLHRFITKIADNKNSWLIR